MIFKPILLDLPIPITTPRLILRPPSPGDGKKVNEAIQESFDELHEWMHWAHSRPTVEESEEFVRLAAAEWILRKELDLRLWDKTTGELIGGAGYHDIDWKVPRLEIGYWVRASRSGQGLITEAVNAMTRYALEVIGVRRVEIRCDKDNLKSRGVPERLGYKLDVIFERNELKPDGSTRDTCVYSRLDTQGLPKLEVHW
jgi:ribosomal-protein-serine acetyltransferase